MTDQETGKAWYETLYVDFEDYDQELYTQQTREEVDFIEVIIDPRRAQRILDVGCGTGRHSLELAQRGYTHITAVDLSASMLEQARAKATAEGLQITFVQKDARDLGYEAQFDLVLMLCEGGFSLMETDEMDRPQPGEKL
ncbi:MAG TPA: class I SAM-dependent methyltransferase [Candidatus Sulfomarinibacteraceae bacterium]|nr:class I SAM-dependent methyltransferase [Candidatus Sulfomarinibacteraceae bacterium]